MLYKTDSIGNTPVVPSSRMGGSNRLVKNNYILLPGTLIKGSNDFASPQTDVSWEQRPEQIAYHHFT